MMMSVICNGENSSGRIIYYSPSYNLGYMISVFVWLSMRRGVVYRVGAYRAKRSHGLWWMGVNFYKRKICACFYKIKGNTLLFNSTVRNL